MFYQDICNKQMKGFYMGRYRKFQNNMVRTSSFTSRSISAEMATRKTAWNDWGTTFSFLPNPSETLRAMGKDISEYKYLLEDSHVNGCLSSRKAGVLGQSWSLDRNNCLQRQYEIIKSIFDGWPIIEISNEMLNACFFGYQPAETLWEKVLGLVLPKALVPKDPDWFRFSDTNELRYMSKTNMTQGEEIPPYKFIVARYRASYERPYGRPLGSCVYWPVKFRHAGIKFWTMFTERFGMPWIKASYPLGSQLPRVQEMIDILDKTIQDGIVAYPTEFNVEALKMNDTASSDIFKNYVEEMNKEISIGILGQTLTTEVGETGGAYALGKVHATIRDDIVAEDKAIIEGIFNTLISWIYEINWPTADIRPKFKLIEASAPTESDGKLAVYLKQAGVKFTKEYFQKRFNLADTEFDISAGDNNPLLNPEKDLENSVNSSVEDLTHETRDTGKPTGGK